MENAVVQSIILVVTIIIVACLGRWFLVRRRTGQFNVNVEAPSSGILVSIPTDVDIPPLSESPKSKESTQPASEQSAEVNLAEIHAPIEASEHSPPEFMKSSDANISETKTVKDTHDQTIEQRKANLGNETGNESPGATESEAGRVLADSAVETEPKISDSTEEKTEREGVSQVGRRRLSPEKRGGARRGQRSSESKESESSSVANSRVPRPELVCWEQSRQWYLGIEMPDEYLDSTSLEVLHEEIRVSEDRGSRWELASIDGVVRISSSVTMQDVELRLADKSLPYLVFKLSGENLEQGRLIRYATRGSFLVIVPHDWQRNEQLSGPSSVSVAPCKIAGFKAHYFMLDHDSSIKIAFITPDGRSVVIPNRATRFELVGSLIPDANEVMGPLFGKGPPRIRSRDLTPWSDIKTIVVGKEGERQTSWRRSFTPVRDSEDQDLAQLLSNRSAGWYFIRFYNSNEELVESLDFRFANGLEDIRIPPHSPLPGDNGHAPVRVDFLHTPDCRVEMGESYRNNLTVDYHGNRTSIEIIPDPDWDTTHWRLGFDDESKVDVTVLVERVWWAIDTVADREPEWSDRPLRIPADYLSATSRRSLKIRFPRRRWTRKAYVGFQQSTARAYYVEVTQHEVNIPLNHFEGSSALDGLTQDIPLKLWVEDFKEQVVGTISSSPKTKTDRTIPQRQTGKPPILTIPLRLKRLQKYLTILDVRMKDRAFSQMARECKQNWVFPGCKAKRSDNVLQTACVIAMGWRLQERKGLKPLGKRRGWVREFVNIANTNRPALQKILDKHDLLQQQRAELVPQLDKNLGE